MSYQNLTQNLFNPFLSKEAWIYVFFKFFFKHHISKHIFNTFSTNLHPISFHFSFNPFVKLNLVELKFYSIQCKVHAMSFNIFIQMELSFHKINFFFINWLSLVVPNNLEPKLILSRWSWLGELRMKHWWRRVDNLVMWSWWLTMVLAIWEP